jgi:M6 family metalloprotease-like protein
METANHQASSRLLSAAVRPTTSTTRPLRKTLAAIVASSLLLLAQAAVALPNLTPYQPTGWSDKIVVSTTTGTSTDSATLTTADTLFLDWAVLNNGTTSAGAFPIYLYVDGSFWTSWSVSSLSANYYVYVSDYSLGSLAAGAHTLTITADPLGTISESNESDNSYTKPITVGSVYLPAPTLSTPANTSTGQSTTPTFSWSAVGGAASYRIIVAKSAVDLPTDPTSSTGGPSVVINDTTSARSYIPSAPFTSGTTYYWKVQGSSGTQFGLWSTPFSFTAGTPTPIIRIQPTELTFSCSAGSVPPPPLATPDSSSRPSWDGLLRGMSASPFPFHEEQPDGTPISLFLRGGVNLHWLEDSNGFTVLEDQGSYVYAKLDPDGLLVPTPLMVGKGDPHSIGLAPGTLPKPSPTAQPTALRNPVPAGAVTPPSLISPAGNVKNVVILMRFANHTGRTLPTVANFTTIFNAVGGDPTIAPSGSVRDVYYENSFGTMTLNSTVVAWVTLPHTEAYYADGVSGLGLKVHEAIQDALVLADPLIDFSQFDDDHDGFVDTITFIHSGYGAEWGGTDVDGATLANRIWSHRWSIPTWTSAEGIKVSSYDVNPGFWGLSGTQPTHIGVICHETGHFFGLPDLYDTDSTSSGIGSWCMMANSWGFTGDQLNPPHFSAWSKIALGWVTPTIITAPGTYAVPQSETTPKIFRINTGYSPGEYLLVENRQPQGFDKNIPQGGLAIWHIDENKATGNTDEGFPGQAGWPPNNRHYEVALLQADGNYDLEHNNNRGDAGDLYRSGGVTEISHITSPNSDAYQGGNVVKTDNRLYAVSAPGPTMTFNFSPTPSGNSFVIYNDGSATLTVSSIALDQSAPWISWSSPSLPFNIGPGAAQTITVAADCAQAPPGKTLRRILVSSNDQSQGPDPAGVNITVDAPAPVISVTPASQDFGSIQLATTADLSFTVQNTGGATLSGTASVPAPFTIVSGSPYSLTANQTTTVTVRYSPISAGTNSQNVTFTGGGGASAAVSGTGYPAALLDYALGTDPNRPAEQSGALTSGILLQNGIRNLSLSFKRRKNAATLGLQYVPEVSGDRQTWFSDTLHVQEVSVQSLDAQFDWVTVIDLTPPDPTTPRFIRLGVIQN